MFRCHEYEMGRMEAEKFFRMELFSLFLINTLKGRQERVRELRSKWSGQQGIKVLVGCSIRVRSKMQIISDLFKHLSWVKGNISLCADYESSCSSFTITLFSQQTFWRVIMQGRHMFYHIEKELYVCQHMYMNLLTALSLIVSNRLLSNTLAILTNTNVLR